MKRGESDSRLRWAFGLAVLLHVGALAVVAHLPLAQASGGGFDQITVFGADAPFPGSLVTLVDLPASGPNSPGPAVSAAPSPGPEKQYEVQPAPPSPPHPEQHTGRGPTRPEVSARPPDPGPAPPPAAVAPVGGGGQGSQPVEAGTPSPSGTVPGPEGSGGEGGEVSPGPAAGGGGGGGPTGTPEAGGGGSGQGGSGTGGSPAGEPGGTAEATNPVPPKVEWANPKVLRTVQPVYPPSAAANGVEGTVVMKVLVGEQGQVVEAEVLRSSHDPRLDKAALTAVHGWRFEPATQDGKAHPVYARASITFKLP